MITIDAYQIADELPIRRIRAEYKATPAGESPTELFYNYQQGHIFILHYGVVTFANVDAIDQTNFIKMLRQLVPEATVIEGYQENFVIKTREGSEKPVFAYNELIVPLLDEDILRITMLHVAQSAALDYYQASAQSLLDASTDIVRQLEQFGTLRISKKKLLKFIGRTLNTKNRIFDNLYVLDSPPIVWESELLGVINSGLYKTFDIGVRFREIDTWLKMIENNLSLFVDLINERESRGLEWIIIILILIEVFHLLVSGVLTII